MSLLKNKIPVRQGNKFAWSRRQNESFEHFELFNAFLRSNDRSITALASQNNLQETFLNNIAKDNQWVERAAAYDFHNLEQETGLKAELIPTKATNIQHMSEKHMTIANKAQVVAAIGFSLLENYIKDYEYARQHGDDLPPKPAIKPEDIVKMARFGTELERLTLGQASKIVENKTNYEKLSIDKLEALQEILAEAEGEDEDE